MEDKHTLDNFNHNFTNGTHSPNNTGNGNNKVIIIQQGIFMEDKVISITNEEESVSVSPIEINWGYFHLNDQEKRWDESRTVGVMYKHGRNQEVSVEISEEKRNNGFAIGYIIKMCTLPRSRNENFITEHRAINISGNNYLGKYIKIPVINFAKTPYSNHQYNIVLNNLNNPKLHFNEKIQFSGKITVVYYGFTSKNSSDYMNDRELPWCNYLNEFKLEGKVQVYHLMNQQQQTITNPIRNSLSTSSDESKPLSVMNDVWVRIPQGKNLLWRIGYDQFDLDHGKQTFVGHFESEPLFYDTSY